MRGSLRAVLLKLVVFAAFTLSVTGLLASVIGNVQPFTRFYPVKAEFADATGLLKSDVVKVAGVTVGKVVGAEVRGGRALVTLLIRKDVRLPRGVRAAIRYRNLLGQRMVVLTRDPHDPDDRPLRPGDTIPLSRTSPALDLSVVFNTLRPALRALNPEDANLVARAVVRIFAGREARLQDMVGRLADLAEALGQRGPVAARLVRDLSAVVTDLARRDRELRSILGSFDQVLGALAARSDELARAVQGLGDASSGLAALLEANRPPLDEAVRQLAVILALVAQHKADLDATLRALPATTHALNRATTYGEVANLAVVCLNGSAPTGGPCPRHTASSGLASIFRAAAGGGGR